MKLLGIGSLAELAGVRIETVHFYERLGLVAPQGQLGSGCRGYSVVALARLRFIRRALALGFTLKEVRDLLSISSQYDVSSLKRSAQSKLAGVEERIAALEKIRRGHATIIAASPSHGRSTDCPALNALEGETPI